MNNILLKEYINKLTKEKLTEITQKQNITLTQHETNTLYHYIKEKNQEFINNPDQIINELKPQLTQQNYQKLLTIYNQYKTTIKTYFP